MIRKLMVALALLASFWLPNAWADKPFAEHKLVLQITDMDPSKHELVLNVATNVAKHYGPDKVDIEIVAFGPGLRLMFEESNHSDRINGLVENAGVRFAGCSNTVRNMAKKLGHPPALNSNVTVVPAGAVRIMELVNQGYTLIKP